MPDYMFLLESRLSPEQRAVMMRVQELSAAMGFNLYLTGGTVRDLITGASLRDLDFTVEGNPTKIARSEEHPSDLPSPCNLVCRLLLEKKKNQTHLYYDTC